MSPQLKEDQYSDITQHTNAQCKIVIFPWKFGLGQPNISDSQLSEASRLDISSQVKSCTFSKQIGSPAGSFSFTLTNSPGIGSQDWKDIIKCGYWCLIYMSNDGSLHMNPKVGPNLAKSRKSEAKYIRCVGYIEKVGPKAETEDNKSIDTEFEVTGRDFGIVYEETNIWHNMFKFDQILLQSIRDTELNIIGNVRIHTAIKFIHDLFYFPMKIPGAKVNDHKSLLDIGLQWLLPKEMLQDQGFDLTKMSKGTFWGNIPGVADFSLNGIDVTTLLPKKGGDICKTGAGLAVDRPTDYLSGNAWEQLKRLSVPQYHELFCETRDDGTPRLIFRPIPWGISQSKYKTNARYIKKYIHINETVLVGGADLPKFDLAEDDHARYNSFLATVSTGLINTEDNISLLDGTPFPLHNRASIRRHGFRPMHVTVDSIVKNDQLANGTADFAQLLEFNWILYDYWNVAVFAETGHLDKIGSNDVKIGKVLKFKDDVPYMNTKRYYIEGYVDTFQIDDNRSATWTQNISLTRGLEEDALRKGTGFGVRNEEFTAPGEYTPANSGDDK